MTQYHLDDLDIDILRKLSENARCPYQEIARECGVSGTSIHQRIQRLTSLGIIQGSETHIDATALGYSTCAYMGFFLTDPAQFNTVIETQRHTWGGSNATSPLANMIFSSKSMPATTSIC